MLMYRVVFDFWCARGLEGVVVVVMIVVVVEEELDCDMKGVPVRLSFNRYFCCVESTLLSASWR